MESERAAAVRELVRLADQLANGWVNQDATKTLLDGPEDARWPLQHWYTEARRDPTARALADDLQQVLVLLARATSRGRRDDQVIRRDGVRLVVLAGRLVEHLAGETTGGKHAPKPRGRYRTDANPKADAKAVRDWQAAKAAGVATIAEYAEARGLDEGEIRAAIDRHRKRLRRPKST